MDGVFLRMLRARLLPLLGVALGACGGGSAADDGRAGPCVHFFAVPVLTLVAVTNAATGAVVAQVQLNQISIDGLPLDLVSLPAVASNVQPAGSGLRCTLPCGFSVTEGLHRFELSAAGFKPKGVSVQAVYPSFTGGCPSRSSGSTPLSVSLEPAG